MTTPPPARPRVLAVGPYERDNVGDLLFLMTTERYLPGVDVVASAPFASDMTELLGRRVEALGERLREEEYDAIWSVGGQVGGTSMDAAYRISMDPDVYARYEAAPYAERREIVDRAVGGAPIVSPYVPTPGAFPLNAGALTVLNSVGVAGMRSHPPHVREELWEVLRSTDLVSVRDKESSDFLRDLGVEHTLAPDVVHAISVLDPFDWDPAADNVVVQVSTRILDRIGRRRFAQRLVESPGLDGLRIRFLLAGTVDGTDSFADMEKLAGHLAAMDPGREVEIITDRRPDDLVDHLRRARIVIATSLHVRIISAAYGVPRLNLARRKVNSYAAHWDPHMPYDVRVPQLGAAIDRALALGSDPAVRAASDDLSRRAHDNVQTLADDLLRRIADQTPEQRAERAAARRSAWEPIAARRLACDLDTTALRTELEEARRELEQARTELAEAQGATGPKAPVQDRARRLAGKVRRSLPEAVGQRLGK